MASPEETEKRTPEEQDKVTAEQVLERCIRIVDHVNRFKKPRLERIKLYRDLYAGKVKKKYRQPFNVVLPVFSGSMDTLMAAFNDDLATEIVETEPADYLAVRKIDTLWQMETTSVAPTAKFPLKTRQDRSNALFSGRGFMMNYAESDPEYHNCFEIFELEDAIFEPNGGGHLENHRYAGRQNIVRTASQLKSGYYDQKQVKALLDKAAKTDYDPAFDDEEGKEQLSKFKAMGLNAQDANYVGEQMFKLVEMGIVAGGQRYHIVFSPWYKTWLRFSPLKEVCSTGLWPWVSWATHEDNKNFLSKSYADDLYTVADAVHTLFNQELTNREKKNFNARAYDREMFPDVAKLDQAQTRPDALVPVDTKGGARRIADGIFTFETAELNGTINLIEWMKEMTGTSIGVTDLAEGGVQDVSKKATVVFAEQQNITKRLLLRSSPYTEAMGEICKLFVQGLKDHMPAEKALKWLGIEGEGWEPVIRRTDLYLYGDIDVRIISSSIEMKNSQLKKESRLKVLEAISADPIKAQQINPQWVVEEMLRSGGEYEDSEIKLAMDTKSYGNKEEVSYAHAAIQAIQHNEKPNIFYGATTLFMQIVHDFAVNNRTTLGERKYHALIDFEMAHASIAQDNMLRKARNEAFSQPMEDVSPETPDAPAMKGDVPSPMTQVRQVAAQLP